MKIDSEKSIIELGSGTGGNLKYLFKDFNEITGVELDTFSYITVKLSCPNSEIFKLDINDHSSIKKISISGNIRYTLSREYKKIQVQS